jgi:hypothetical protein
MRLTSREALKARNLPSELTQRIDPAKPEEAHCIAEEYLGHSGIELIGRRTLPEIAECLLAAVADAREAPLEMPMAALIDGFTMVRGPAREPSRLANLLRPHKIDIGISFDSFDLRLQLEFAGRHWGSEFSTVRAQLEYSQASFSNYRSRSVREPDRGWRPLRRAACSRGSAGRRARCWLVHPQRATAGSDWRRDSMSGKL